MVEASSCRSSTRWSSGHPSRRRPIRTLVDRAAHSVCISAHAPATRVKQMCIALLAAQEVAQRADAAQSAVAVVEGAYILSARWSSRVKCGPVACSVTARQRSTSVRGKGHERPTSACEHASETCRSVLWAERSRAFHESHRSAHKSKRNSCLFSLMPSRSSSCGPGWASSRSATGLGARTS